MRRYEAEDLEIFVLTCNRAKYLERALESIFNQTLKGFDVIVLDNGSTDATDEVVKKYSSEITMYKSTVNMGAKWNFDRVKKYAKRNLVMVFHDDDVLHPNYIKEAIDAFNLRDDIVCVGTKMYPFCWNDVNKTYKRIKLKILDAKQLAAKCYWGYPLPFSGMVYKTKAYVDNKTNLDMYGKIFDRPQIYTTIGNGKCALIDAEMVGYGIHEEQDSKNYLTGPFKSELCALHSLYKFYLGTSFFTSAGRAFLLNNYRHLRNEYNNTVKNMENCTLKEYIIYAKKNKAATRGSIVIGYLAWIGYCMLKRVGV